MYNITASSVVRKPRTFHATEIGRGFFVLVVTVEQQP
jgi:hypothetical protein